MGTAARTIVRRVRLPLAWERVLVQEALPFAVAAAHTTPNAPNATACMRSSNSRSARPAGPGDWQGSLDHKALQPQWKGNRDVWRAFTAPG
jgi:hypothetical protein